MEKHSLSPEDRIFRVTSITPLLTIAVISALFIFTDLIGEIRSPTPTPYLLMIIVSFLVTSIWISLHPDKRNSRYILAATILLGLYVVYIGGIYAAVLAICGLISIMAASPQNFRLWIGYGYSASLACALIMHDVLSPTDESLRLLIALAVLPYPLSFLLNPSIPIEKAQLNGFLTLLVTGFLTTVAFTINQGFASNTVVVLIALVVVFAFCWLLQRITLTLGIVLIFLTSLIALNNAWTMGSLFSPVLIVYLLVPFLLSGPVGGLGGSFVVLLFAAIGFSQHEEALNMMLIFRVFIAALIAVFCFHTIVQIRTEGHEPSYSLKRFIDQSRIVSNTTVLFLMLITTSLIGLLISNFNQLDALHYKHNTITLIEELIDKNEIRQHNSLLTAGGDIPSQIEQTNEEVNRLVNDLKRSSDPEFIEQISAALEISDKNFKHSLEMNAVEKRSDAVSASEEISSSSNHISELLKLEINEIHDRRKNLFRKTFYTLLTLLTSILFLVLFAILLGRLANKTLSRLVFSPLGKLNWLLEKAAVDRSISLKSEPGAAIEVNQLTQKADHLLSKLREDFDLRESFINQLKLIENLNLMASRVAGFFHTALNLRTMEFNISDGFADRMGYSDKEAFSRALYNAELIHPDDIDKVSKFRQSISDFEGLPLDNDASVIFRALKKSGEEIWFKSTVRKIHINNEIIILSTFQDVSEFLGILQSLSNINQALDAAADVSRLGVLQLNNRTGQISANPSAFDIFGIDRNTTLSVNDIFSACHPDDFDMVQQYVSEHRKGSVTEPIEHRLLINGETTWIRASARYQYNDAGEFISNISVLDITNDKERESELKSIISELQDQRAKQSRMLSVVSHELRTPLSNSHLILNQLDQTNLDSFLPILKSNSENLLSIMDDLRMVVRPSEVLLKDISLESPAKIIQQTISSMTNLANQSGVEIHLSFNELAHEESMINSSSLRQIVSNLTKNVFLHAEAKNVWVEVTVTETNSGKRILNVTTEDDGKGISEDFQKTMYEPFIRGDSKNEGTGLGLYIIKDLTTSLSGNIVYFNTPKGGAGFKTTIPLLTKSDQEIEQLSPEQELLIEETLTGKKVLLAEDDPTTQNLFRTILMQEGAKVTIASNAQIGLKEFSDEQPDIVITDAMMPEMDGYEFTARLRKLGFNGPIIAATAATIGDERDRLLEAGADAVLFKPFTRQQLKQTLFERLKNRDEDDHN